MKHAILLPGLLAATFPALATAPQVDPVVAQAAPFIDRANSEWGTAVVSGDPDALSAPYAEDGIFIGPDGKVTVGKAAIRAMYAARPKSARILEASARSDGRVAVDADDVYEWGSASATVKTDAGVTKKSLGRFLTVWHRQASVWLITRNIAF
jgi:ketosteroid isomerase-like protein